MKIVNTWQFGLSGLQSSECRVMWLLQVVGPCPLVSLGGEASPPLSSHPLANGGLAEHQLEGQNRTNRFPVLVARFRISTSCMCVCACTKEYIYCFSFGVIHCNQCFNESAAARLATNTFTVHGNVKIPDASSIQLVQYQLRYSADGIHF